MEAYNSEADYYNARKAALGSWKTEYTPASAAERTDVSGWTTKDGKRFDGFLNGVLIDAKADYGPFLLPNGEWESFFPGNKYFLGEAVKQTERAAGTPIFWVFAQKEVAENVAVLLSVNGYGNITCIWKPMG